MAQDAGGLDAGGALALQNLPRDLAVVKLENDSLFALAAARPREPAKILEGLVAELRAFPQFAEEVIYDKPVGTAHEIVCRCGHKYLAQKLSQETAACPKCERYQPARQPRRVVQRARGLSIRAAETLAAAWGFNKVRADLEQLDDFTVQVTASFTDVQTCRVWEVPRLVSRRYRSRGGGAGVTEEGRFFDLVVPAAVSKAIREAVVRSLPIALKAAYEAEAEEIIAGRLDDGAVGRIVEAFATKGITLAQLEEYLGRKAADGWIRQHRVDLASVWNAVKQGEAALEEFFGPPPGQAADAADAETPPQRTTAEDFADPQADPNESTVWEGVDEPAAPRATEAKAPETAPAADDLVAELRRQIAEARTPQDFALLRKAIAANVTAKVRDKLMKLAATAELKVTQQTPRQQTMI